MSLCHSVFLSLSFFLILLCSYFFCWFISFCLSLCFFFSYSLSCYYSSNNDFSLRCWIFVIVYGAPMKWMRTQVWRENNSSNTSEQMSRHIKKIYNNMIYDTGRHKFLMDSKHFSCAMSWCARILGVVFFSCLFSFFHLSFHFIHLRTMKNEKGKKKKVLVVVVVFFTKNAQFSNKQKWWRKTKWRRRHTHTRKWK